MKIVEINSNGNGKTSGGKKELGAAEKWLFDTEDGEVRLKNLELYAVFIVTSFYENRYIYTIMIQS